MLNNAAEVIETISACAQIVEQYADDHPELWAVIAAMRSCEDWMVEQDEDSLKNTKSPLPKEGEGA